MYVDYVENGFVMLLWFAILARLVLRRYAHALQRRSSSCLAYRVRMMFLICEFVFFLTSFTRKSNYVLQSECMLVLLLFPSQAIRWFRSIVIYLFEFFVCCFPLTVYLQSNDATNKISTNDNILNWKQKSLLFVDFMEISWDSRSSTKFKSSRLKWILLSNRRLKGISLS